MDLAEKAYGSFILKELAADVLDTIRDGFYILDANWRFVYVNRRACEMAGRLRESVLGRDIWEAFPQLIGSDIGEKLRRAAEADHEVEFEAFSPILRIWVRLRVCPMRGGLTGVYLVDIDQEKRARDRLRDSEERLRFASQVARLGYWERDLATGALTCSDQCKANYGLPPEAELPYQRVLAAIHPDYREQARATTRRAVEEGVDYESEYPIAWPDGSTHWISARGTCVYAEDGTPLRTMGTTLDITDRKRAEEAVREGEERYRLFADAATEGVLVHDFETVLDVSRPFAAIFGYRPDELVGSALADWPMLIEPDALASALDLGRGGPVTRKELACRRRDGTPIALEYEGKDIQYRGRSVRIMIARDVTEAKRNQQRLREMNEQLERQAEERARQLFASRALLRAFFENSPDRLTLMRATADRRFMFEDVNPTLARALRLPREQVIGRTVEQILGAQEAQVPLHYLRETLRTGLSQRWVLPLSAGGQTRTLDVMSAIVPGETDGGDRFVIAAARDITEREQLEAQLRQAQKMEAVGQLTGGVAHDFNNLLTAIVASLELIRVKTAEKHVHRLADTALRAAMRGGQLTHQLLSFSRRQRLQPTVADLGALLRESEPLLRGAVGETITLRFDVTPRLWASRIDPAQFQAAVMNLVVNARDAMPDGGSITLAARNAAVAAAETGLDLAVGDYVVFAVGDTGAGMSKDVAARAFEPFFTTKDIGKGSGLGLSMVHGFARQSGGTMRIESEPGQGTTVSLYLPRAEAKLRDSAVDEQGLDVVPRASGTVLVVEDNEELLNATVDVLRTLNYRVYVAATGPEALEVIRRGEPIDVMLCDLVLPGGMTGLEIARQVQALRPGTKALLTSGYSGEAFGGLGQEFPFLAKPYRPAELGRRIDALLKGVAQPA